MIKKQMIWKTKGMNRDLSVSAFNNEFSFENMNLRLSTNEGNTLMSWVNERGTSLLHLSISEKEWEDNPISTEVIQGCPIGTAIINHQLVLFTTDSSKSNGANTSPDHIYTFKFSSNADTLEGKLLYSGNLNFSEEHPIETLVSYESETIQKVYWTDGYNQPRVINIAASLEKLAKWNSEKEDDNGVDTYFDFIPAIQLNEEMYVERNDSGGMFAPGVIQYAFAYINKFGQESNLVQVSPLYYLSHNERGASPEDKVANSFVITLKNLDSNFDYIRLYSVQRTSLNDVPIAKMLQDYPITTEIVSNVPEVSKVYTASGIASLPMELDENQNWRKIIGINLTSGSYDITISNLITSPLSSFSYDDDTNFGYYTNQGVYKITRYFYVITEKIFKEGYGSPYVGKYYAYFQYNPSLDSYIRSLISGYSPDTLRFARKVLNNGYQSIHCVNELFYKYFVYDYESRTWYITSSLPTVVEDTTVEERTANIICVDNGTTGSTMDPTELLYVGGREITALTMRDKDGTLFLGNIEEKTTPLNSLQDYYDSLRDTEGIPIEFSNTEPLKKIEFTFPSGVYAYDSQLKDNQSHITTFKGGETYRFGFQLQKNTGEWLEPIYLDDVKNTLYPKITDLTTNSYNLVSAKATIDINKIRSIIGNDFDILYKRIRPVLVYPTIGDRSVICQGVLNPTVFNIEDRVSNSPFAQASWFFRPYMHVSDSSDGTTGWTVIDPTNSLISIINRTSLNSQSDFDVSDSFINLTYCSNVHILVASLMQSSTYIVPQMPSLSVCYETKYKRDPMHPVKTYGSIPIDNVLYLGKTSGQNAGYMYAFISSDNNAWPPEGEVINPSSDVESIKARYTAPGFTVLGYGSKGSNVMDSFKMPVNRSSNNCMTPRDSTGKSYYSKPAVGAPDSFTFKFGYKPIDPSQTKMYYEVEFKDSQNVSSTGVYTANTDGESLVFTHYNSLPTITGNDSVSTAKTLEIQGALSVYNNVYASAVSSLESNTQFFVDQSIVTLNSPDLDYNPEVQTYGMEGLRLRIVGAIPITANTSYHKITHGTMQEVTAANGSRVTEARFGNGEIDTNITHFNIDTHAGKRLVADYLWNDVFIDSVDTSGDEDKVTAATLANYLVYPWQGNGSLNNDARSKDKASSWMNIKKISHTLYSVQSEYLSNVFELNADTDAQVYLWENQGPYNMRLRRQRSDLSDINYYPNIDKILYHGGDGYKIYYNQNGVAHQTSSGIHNPISMKYKSNTHAAIALKSSTIEGNKLLNILPKAKLGDDSYVGEWTIPDSSHTTTFWGDTNVDFTQGEIDLSSSESKKFNFLWLGELYRPDDTVLNQFGGKSKAALAANTWNVGGAAVNISSADSNGNIELQWTHGDTYYQRYDCLKTSSYTLEDSNQLVEILSFMCETYTNIDGRYDRNRGQIDNTNMRPEIFGISNPVYSQKDNFFNYKKYNNERNEKYKYPNQITYSRTKTAGADVDLWTNITLASVLELDGDKGEITSLQRFNDQLIAFQDTGISQILYNENVQIASTAGVPIEIANSGKVQGKRYISDTIGCSNKWSICQTPSGIYFIDSHDKSIYLFNGQLQNLSVAGGFNSWSKQNISITSKGWTPLDFDDFTTQYDKLNGDVYFINMDVALAYSEKIGTFTSFYNYNGIPYLCNLDGKGIWVKSESYSVPNPPYGRVTHGLSSLWEHQAGQYSNFFGSNYPYWMTLVGNPEPQMDKTFTNLEFRACIESEGEYQEDTGKFIPALPFDSLETWNEYQHGITGLYNKTGHELMQHHLLDNTSSLKRKFRIWRCDIPRDNAPLDTDAELNISRFKIHPLDRMRNPWIYLKLKKDAAYSDSGLGKTEIHDIMMSYYE